MGALGRIIFLCAVTVVIVAAVEAFGSGTASFPGTKVIKTGYSYETLRSRIDAAIARNKVYVVSRASASAGARRRGVKIPGNMVIGV
jgi:hypothetical protein